MLSIKDYKKDLKKLADDYFINTLNFVPDITAWAKNNNSPLGEPHLPMKLVTGSGDELTMVMQAEVNEEMLSDVVKNLGIRWSVKDNVTDMDKKLNTAKRRLAYCFLKEYARSLNKAEGDELSEDEWVLDEMEYLGFFNE